MDMVGDSPINGSYRFACNVGAEDVAFGPQKRETGSTFSEKMDYNKINQC